MCHFIDLRAHTEVMSVRQEPQMRRISCAACLSRENGNCRGLSRKENAFSGDEALMSLAKKREDWLSQQV
jgi:hypothetical protein